MTPSDRFSSDHVPSEPRSSRNSNSRNLASSDETSPAEGEETMNSFENSSTASSHAEPEETDAVERPSIMEAELPPTPDLPNPYYRDDKIAQDYQDRHQGDSIWNSRSRFYSDSGRTNRSGRSNSGRSNSGRSDAARSDWRDRSEQNRPNYSEDRGDENHHDRESRPEQKDSDDHGDKQVRGERNDRSYHPTRRYDNSDDRPRRNGRTGDSPSRYNHDRSRREPLEPTTGAKGRRGEPITLAEELALERQGRGKDNTSTPGEQEKTTSPGPEKLSLMAELETLSMKDLIVEARKENMEMIDDELRQDLIFRILQQRIRAGGMMFGEGTLEILPDEFGFLRSPEFHYISCPDDIYISPSQIRRFGLRNGLTISGQIRPPKERERYFALLRVEAINHEDPNSLQNKKFFDDLTPTHPNERIVLEHSQDEFCSRVLDLIAPIGFGQRGLIVSPPRAGKTILMQKIARSVLKNYPDSYVFMLLVDERPEEVTDMEREIKGTHCEVISSTFDEPPGRHIQVSEMVLEKAKRMVEYGKNVVIFLDSITRLARAWNAECPDSGKTLSGGVDANALARPKKFFGAARKMEEGGSLTIIATALIETGSAMDEVIFEEFKGTGNLEIRLDRALVDKRIWPAIDINQTGTRREEVILTPDEYGPITRLRQQLSENSPTDAMNTLLNELRKTSTNKDFLENL